MNPQGGFNKPVARRPSWAAFRRDTWRTEGPRSARSFGQSSHSTKSQHRSLVYIIIPQPRNCQTVPDPASEAMIDARQRRKQTSRSRRRGEAPCVICFEYGFFSGKRCDCVALSSWYHINSVAAWLKETDLVHAFGSYSLQSTNELSCKQTGRSKSPERQRANARDEGAQGGSA